MLTVNPLLSTAEVLSQEDIANADAGDTADDKNEDDVTFDEKKETITKDDTSDNALFGGDDGKDENSDVEIVEAAVTQDGVFSDITDENLARYVEVLNAFGFVSGYEDGTFKPDEPISRVDFMSMLIKTLNLTADNVKVSGCSFYDVDEGTYEYNVMSYAIKQNYYSLYNDNTVRPSAPLTYADAVTAYLKAMGYTSVAEAKGGFPYGYLSIATDLNLYKGIDTSGNLSRKDAVTLIYKCIKAPVNKLISSGGRVQYSNDTDDNILSVYHNIYADTGVVNATQIDGIGDYAKTRAGEIVIGGVNYTCQDKSFTKYLGYKVEYFFRDTDEKKEIVFIHKDKSVKEMRIYGDDVISYKNGTLKYFDNGKRESVDIDRNHTFIQNGRYCKKYTAKDFKPSNGYITLVANDGSNYDVVFENQYFNALSKTVSADGGIMTITFDYGVRPIELNISNQNLYIELYKDGNRMDAKIGSEKYLDGDGVLQTRTILPSIPADSLVSVFSDEFETNSAGKIIAVGSNARYLKIIINTPSITGTVREYDEKNNIVTIGKEDYEIANDNFMDKNDTAFEAGVKGKFLLDYSGRIAAWIAGVSTFTFDYAYLINAVIDSGVSDKVPTKLLTKTGEIKVLYMDAKTKINNAKAGSPEKAIEKLAYSAKLIDENAAAVSQLVKFSSLDGKYINKIMTVTADLGVSDGFDRTWLRRANKKETVVCRKGLGYMFGHYMEVYKKIDSEDSSGNNVTTSDGTTPVKEIMTFALGKPEVIFVVPPTPTFDDDDYFVKEEWDYGDDVQKQVELYDLNDSLKPSATLIYDSSKVKKVFDRPMFIIDKYTKTLDEDGMECVKVKGYNGAVEKEFLLEDSSLQSKYKTGDIVMLKGNNETVDDMVKVSSISEIVNYDYNDPDVKIYMPSPVVVGAQKLATSIYEAYSVDTASRNMILQLGPDIEEGKRTFQRGFHWTSNIYSFHHGATLVDYRKDTGEITMSSTAVGAIKGAREFGHESSSKILVGEQSSINGRYIVIVNVY